MTESAGEIEVGAKLVSAAYVLDAAAAKAYGGAIESPRRRHPSKGIHDDQQAARNAGFSEPIAAGEQTIAVIAQFLGDNFGTRFMRGGRIDIALTRPVFFGDTLTSHAVVERLEGERAVLRIRVENQRGESVLTGSAAVRIAEA